MRRDRRLMKQCFGTNEWNFADLPGKSAMSGWPDFCTCSWTADMPLPMGGKLPAANKKRMIAPGDFIATGNTSWVWPPTRLDKSEIGRRSLFMQSNYMVKRNKRLGMKLLPIVVLLLEIALGGCDATFTNTAQQALDSTSSALIAGSLHRLAKPS